MVAIIAILVLAAGGIGIATNGTFDLSSINSPGEPSSTTEPIASTDNTTQPPTSSTSSGLTATADELVTAYKADKTAADTKYKGKTVTVTGKMDSYTLSTFIVTLKGDTNLDYIITCEFNETDSEKILSLEPEQSLKISGTVDGLVSGEIKLKICSFIQ
jgi:hypothetical protein